MRLIDADALYIEIMDRGIDGLQLDDLSEIQQAVDDAPTVDPVRRGKWECINGLERYACSCCGKHTDQPWGKDGAILYAYCPYCGAKLE